MLCFSYTATTIDRAEMRALKESDPAIRGSDVPHSGLVMRSYQLAGKLLRAILPPAHLLEHRNQSRLQQTSHRCTNAAVGALILTREL